MVEHSILEEVRRKACEIVEGVLSPLSTGCEVNPTSPDVVEVKIPPGKHVVRTGWKEVIVEKEKSFLSSLGMLESNLFSALLS